MIRLCNAGLPGEARCVHTFASDPSGAAPTFYEQMFAKATTSKLAQRTLGALRLTHSFLLLEDDYDVDWEVDRDEELTQSHPHRVPLRGPARRPRNTPDRRMGEVPSRRQPCLSPVGPTAERGREGRMRRLCTAARKPRSPH
jgi:hypothetical protein